MTAPVSSPPGLPPAGPGGEARLFSVGLLDVTCEGDMVTVSLDGPDAPLTVPQALNLAWQLTAWADRHLQDTTLPYPHCARCNGEGGRGWEGRCDQCAGIAPTDDVGPYPCCECCSHANGVEHADRCESGCNDVAAS